MCCASCATSCAAPRAPASCATRRRASASATATPRRWRFPDGRPRPSTATAAAGAIPSRLSISEGISVGWGDNYQPHLEGQELELTSLPAGPLRPRPPRQHDARHRGERLRRQRRVDGDRPQLARRPETAASDRRRRPLPGLSSLRLAPSRTPRARKRPNQRLTQKTPERRLKFGAARPRAAPGGLQAPTPAPRVQGASVYQHTDPNAGGTMARILLSELGDVDWSAALRFLTREEIPTVRRA